MKKGYFMFEVNDKLFFSFKKAKVAADALGKNEDLFFKAWHWRNGWKILKYRIIHHEMNKNLLTIKNLHAIKYAGTTKTYKELLK